MSSNNLSNTQLLTVNEASNTFNKSIATIRKLIETDKIKYQKENNRIFIPLDELVKHYGNPNEFVSTNHSTKDNIVSNTDSTNISTNVFLERIIKDKDSQIEFLHKEIQSKSDEVSKLYKLLENQQSLNLQVTALLSLEKDTNTQKKKRFLWF